MASAASGCKPAAGGVSAGGDRPPQARRAASETPAMISKKPTM
jgi:hypothetical protein